MAEPRVLLVDDEESFRVIAHEELRHAGYVLETAGTLAEARDLLAERAYDVVFLDLRLPDGNGLDLIPEIHGAFPATQVIVLTAFGTVQEAIWAMKQGAFDFLAKPCTLGQMEAVLQKALQIQALARQNLALQRDVDRLKPSDQIVGSTPQLREVLGLIDRVAGTDSTVLIRGESGVGKELVARAVHRTSRRSRRPFVVVDCASLHENLLQSELFGHEKGAYTGAVRLKHGLFEVADRGTLFLDEIGEVTPALQVKLLRVLETGIFRRVGGTSDVSVDVRVIAATNRDLARAVEEGTFRDDLYYRLNVVGIEIPPLRERREDIPALVQHFVTIHNRELRKSFKGVDGATMKVLLSLPWKGNVRELDNVIEHAMILGDGDWITMKELPRAMRTETDLPVVTGDGLRDAMRAYERAHIQSVLAKLNNDKRAAAERLGMSLSSLYRKIEELEVGPESGKQDERS